MIGIDGVLRPPPRVNVTKKWNVNISKPVEIKNVSFKLGMLLFFQNAISTVNMKKGGETEKSKMEGKRVGIREDEGREGGREERKDRRKEGRKQARKEERKKEQMERKREEKKGMRKNRKYRLPFARTKSLKSPHGLPVASR